jgi:hypothetical protein
MTAEDQIRHTLARYVHAHDAEDADGVTALFTANGRLSVPSGARPVGRDSVRAFLEDSYARRRSARRRLKHLYGNCLIDVVGARTTAVSDWVAYESIDGGPWTITMIGSSIDQLVLQEGRWLLEERQNVDAGVYEAQH